VGLTGPYCCVWYASSVWATRMFPGTHVMTFVLSGFVLRPMLSKSFTRTLRAPCSQTGFLDPTSLLSTKKRHNLPACLREYPVSGFFVHCPPEPLPYHRINTNIKHKRGEWATLSNTTVGAKRFPKTTPSSTDHLHLLPEFCLEAQEFGPYPIPGHDGWAPLPIQVVICLPQVYKDLV
jgi:hypothetical protein